MTNETFPDLLALIEQDGFRAAGAFDDREGQYNRPCPWCGGRDRFRVQPHHGSYGWFACNYSAYSYCCARYSVILKSWSGR